eukprot:2294675-Pleurochrysis_carterae.AAC.5
MYSVLRAQGGAVPALVQAQCDMFRTPSLHGVWPGVKGCMACDNFRGWAVGARCDGDASQQHEGREIPDASGELARQHDIEKVAA